jgi:hypothetical protein
MKTVKLILLFGMVAFTATSCSNSLSPDSKNGDSSLGRGGQNGQGVVARDTLYTLISKSTLTLTAEQEKLISRWTKGDRYTKFKTRFARINKDAISALRKGKPVALPITPDSVLVVAFKKDDGLNKIQPDSVIFYSAPLHNHKDEWVYMMFHKSDYKYFHGFIRRKQKPGSPVVDVVAPPVSWDTFKDKDDIVIIRRMVVVR